MVERGKNKTTTLDFPSGCIRLSGVHVFERKGKWHLSRSFLVCLVFGVVVVMWKSMAAEGGLGMLVVDSGRKRGSRIPHIRHCHHHRCHQAPFNNPCPSQLTAQNRLISHSPMVKGEVCECTYVCECVCVCVCVGGGRVNNRSDKI